MKSPSLLGTYKVDSNILNLYLKTLNPLSWAIPCSQGSRAYVSADCNLSDFELEELDDKIYNNLVCNI